MNRPRSTLRLLLTLRRHQVPLGWQGFQIFSRWTARLDNAFPHAGDMIYRGITWLWPQIKSTISSSKPAEAGILCIKIVKLERISPLSLRQTFFLFEQFQLLSSSLSSSGITVQSSLQLWVFLPVFNTLGRLRGGRAQRPSQSASSVSSSHCRQISWPHLGRTYLTSLHMVTQILGVVGARVGRNVVCNLL